MGAFLWTLALLGHHLHLPHLKAFFPASPKIQTGQQIFVESQGTWGGAEEGPIRPYSCPGGLVEGY